MDAILAYLVVAVVLTVWAIVVTVRVAELATWQKVVWSLILVLFPGGVGLIVWLLLWVTRRRPGRAS